MSKQALYHQDSKAPLLLEVIKDHKNGTVDLGVDGVVKISACEVVKEPAPGYCTLVKEPKEDSKAAAEKAAAEKAAAEKAE